MVDTFSFMYNNPLPRRTKINNWECYLYKLHFPNIFPTNKNVLVGNGAYHLMILVRCTVLFSKSTSTPSPRKYSLAANLSSASTPWAEKNLTAGLDLVPSHSPKCIKGFTLGGANYMNLSSHWLLVSYSYKKLKGNLGRQCKYL